MGKFFIGGFRQRMCTLCNQPYQPTSGTQKACPSCRKELQRTTSRRNQRKTTARRGGTSIGTTLLCIDCGTEFIYLASKQTRCRPCQYSRNYSNDRGWRERNPEQLREARRRSKDRLHYGGNRELALKRDNYTCQFCGSTDRPHVHHKDGAGSTDALGEQNNALDNLTTLCRPCHARLHMLARKMAVRAGLKAAFETLQALPQEVHRRAHETPGKTPLELPPEKVREIVSALSH